MDLVNRRRKLNRTSLRLVSAAEWEQRAYGSCNEVHSKRLIARAALCALLGLAVAGCAGLFGPSHPDPAARMPALEKRIFALVVETRHKKDPKAHALELDPALTDVARQRSSQMAKANSFVASDPHVSASLLMAADAKFQGLVGENVAAQHFTPGQDIDVEAFAKRFVDTWAASKPHLENLSFADYDKSGVGAAANADTIYVAQIFTTDLGMGGKSEQATPDVQTVPSPREGKEKTKAPDLRGAIAPGQAAK
jgi:uncharacterized protein YkwD